MEDSPSPVYGAALLMRFGSDPIRGSNPRSSAEPCSLAWRPASRVLVSARGGGPPEPSEAGFARKPVVVALVALVGPGSAGEIKVFWSNGPGWLWVVTDFLRG